MPPVGLKLLHPLKPPTYPTTQNFGENPNWYPLTHGHNGIDYGVPLRTSIFATLPGTVIRVIGDNSGYGNHVRVSHADNLTSIYGHMDEHNWSSVHEGDQVVAGQELGLSGNTGHSSGPHLHFEVREGTIAFDPLPFIVTSLGGPVVIGQGDTVVVQKPLFKVRILANPTINVRSGPSIVYPKINSMNMAELADVLELGGTEIWVRTPKGFIALRYNGDNLAEIVTE